MPFLISLDSETPFFLTVELPCLRQDGSLPTLVIIRPLTFASPSFERFLPLRAAQLSPIFFSAIILLFPFLTISAHAS